MKHLLLILSFTLSLATSANAGFYNDRSDWNELGHLKPFYLQGLFDEISLMKLGDDDTTLEFKANLHDCISQYGVKADTLVDMVDNYYQDVANWTVRPRHALVQSLIKFCKL